MEELDSKHCVAWMEGERVFDEIPTDAENYLLDNQGEECNFIPTLVLLFRYFKRTLKDDLH